MKDVVIKKLTGIIYHPFSLSWFWKTSVLQKLWSHLRRGNKYIQSSFRNFLFAEVCISIRGQSRLFSLYDVKAEPLRGNYTGERHLMLSQQLPEFARIGEFSLEKLGCHTDEKNSEKRQGELLQIFTEHKAVYHKSCVSEYNAQKLQRAMQRNQKLLDTSLTVSFSSSIETVAKNVFAKVILLKN